MRSMWAPLLALGLLCAGSAVASAQGCSDEIDRLAQQYALNMDHKRTGETGLPATASAPPATTESRGVLGTERLGSSSGVTSPPDVKEPMAVPPSGGAGSTAPPVSGTRRGGDLTPAERTQMETQLAAARTALREGKTGECLDRLREAEAVVGVTGKRAPQ